MYLGVFISVCCLHIAWCADPKVLIKYTYPKTKILYEHKALEVNKDSDSFMSCVVDNRPVDKKVQWLVQNFATNTIIPISTDTDTQEAFKYQIDKPAANNWRLKIQNVQQSDQALYICRVQLGGQQNMNDSRIISVIQPPQIIDIFTSSDTTAEEGDRIELMCAASGIPPPLITWQLAGGGILPTGGRELTAPKILVESATRAHKGDYKCIAKNVAGTDIRRIYLNVKFQPQLKPEAPEVFQALGYSKELQCEASGNPVPTDQQVLWYKEGTPLEDVNKYVFKNYFGSNYVLMKLTIHDINEADYGQYRCYAENSEGNGQSFVQLSQSSDRQGVMYSETERQSSATLLSFSLTTLIMITATTILHFC